MPSITPRSVVTGHATNLSQWNSKQNDSAANVNAASVVLHVRSRLRQSGVMGFVSFLQALKQVANPAQTISRAQLKATLSNHNLQLSDVDIRAIAIFLGEEVSGAMPISTLRDLIFGKLEGRRQDVATAAFRRMDGRQRGYVAVDEILRNHDAGMHPDLMFGNQTTPIQVHSTFVKSFTALVPPTSLVNLAQWLEYCQCLSGATEKDDYFDLIFARVWHVSVSSSLNDPPDPIKVSNNQVLTPRSSLTLLDDLSQKNLLATALDFSSESFSSMPSPDMTVAAPSVSSAPLQMDLNYTTTTTRKSSRNATLNSTQTAACMTHMYPDKAGLLPKSKDIGVGTKMILSRLRAALKCRGAAGMVGLSRKFRIIDDDNNGFLNLVEFKNAMRECDVDCSDADLRQLFDAFDKDDSQAIDFKEFLNGVREPMNDRRLALVRLAFQKIDRNGDGVLEPSDIVGCYDASKHPDVIAGKRTADAIFREFLETFDVDAKDGKVTPAEWEHYYDNISAVIDHDDYFELMLRNTWHLSGGQECGASSFESTRDRVVVEPESPAIVFTTPKRYGNASAGLASCLQVDLPQARQALSNQPGQPLLADMQHPKELRRIVKRLKTTLKARGGRGYTGLVRGFRLMDSNGSGTLDLNEFRAAMDRLQLHMSANDLLVLFDYFDVNGNGSVDVAEFVNGVRDPMNERRLLFVHMAFDLLDTDHNHVLTVEDVVTKYDARKHPDVLAGRKTDREIYTEFLDTFEWSSKVHDGQVTLTEWTEYYANISASIDDDDYFELMMRNAWHMSGGEGWTANSTNRRVLVNESQVAEIQNDLGVLRYEQIQAQLGKQGFHTVPSNTKVSFYEVLDHSVRTTSVNVKRPGRLRNNCSDGTATCLTMAPAASSTAIKPGKRLGGGGYLATGVAASTYSSNASIPPNQQTFATVGVQPILTRLRAYLKSSQHGFIGLSRAFKRMDSDANGHLSMSEFKQAMAGFGLEDVDARILFNYFDVDHNGTLEIQEFVTGLRGPMNARRLGFVREAFARMDKDGNGVLEPSDIVEAYDASKHPEVIAGRKTPDQVFREFLDTFDVDGHHDAKVTPDMWEHYYANVSASIDDDDYFELMMRNAWHITGGKGWCANSTNRRVLVNESHVVEVENDLGVQASEVPERLERQIKSYMNQPGTIKTLNSVNVTACLNYMTDLPKSAQPPARQTEAKVVPLQAMQRAADAAVRRPSNSCGVVTTSNSSVAQMDGLWGALRQVLRSKGLATIVQVRRSIVQYGKTIGTAQVQAALAESAQVKLPTDIIQKLVDDVRQRCPLRGEDVSSARASTSGFWKCLAMPKDDQLIKMAKRVFAHLQVEAKGDCTPLVLAKAYDAPSHPSVLLGLVQAEDVFKDFARCFDVDSSGCITYDSMDAYCSDLYLSVGELRHCLQMLRDVFHVDIPTTS
ncbi:hypothetical protein H310_07394 [Aphanomyces invadans]|uniref:EF-hand domain-containing protein n=1 Tax=Aphanomyces invadans TaxID=157072 RepID=A0A024U3Q8_9STRA|nr:hypothetical protein H310_07394 [Aphanomyces invadans]ETW00874.1 hypothetical protein H310_07394 [Aphanomyces invadans]|eukprot:XP_008871009.1 hypothetical protein H310_07394 [Aphanomyces invadans]